MNVGRILLPVFVSLCAGALATPSQQPVQGSLSQLQNGNNSFFVLMGQPKEPLSAQDEAELQKMAADYSCHIDDLSKPAIRHIPHSLHVIWLGPKNFPEKSIANLLSWKELHRDWQFIFWTDEPNRPVPIPGMTRRLVQEYDSGILRPYLALSTNWYEKADMLRYTILFREGGVYVDHDMYCNRSIDDLADHFDFVAGCDPSQPHPGIVSNVIVNNSILLTRPQHPILGTAIGRIAAGWHQAFEQYPGSDPDSVLARVLRRTVVPFIGAVKECRLRGHNRDIVLPTSYFYSHHVFAPHVLEKLCNSGYVYAIHHHGL